MQKNKNLLLAFFLTLIIAFCFSTLPAKAQNDKQINGTEHKNTVATFVQKLSKVADKEKGEMGEQVKAVARAQEEIKDKVADTIDKIQNRNKIKTFLIGTDYKNIGQLRSEMVKTGNQIDQLERLLNKATTTSEETKTTLQGQIQTLQQDQQKIEDFLKANESKFSLFGWFAKLFNK
ncbi:MAG: hypothetical protein NTX55_01670 [Candidatus Parcubacteria bacterium]|nr:hypothetical protein [Candidatus Parcubacteria bacterium]